MIVVRPFRFCCYIPGRSTVYLLDSFVAVGSHKLNSLSVIANATGIPYAQWKSNTNVADFVMIVYHPTFMYHSVISETLKHQNAFDKHVHLC